MQNPISKTAFYTLEVRAWDAKQAAPLCGDHLASRLVNDESQRIWDEVKHLSGPNSSIAMRHRIIDDLLEAELVTKRDSTVVVIGAGFDTRSFRHPFGTWIEVDEPSVISYKEERLPASECPNPLTRVPIEFSKESLVEKLKDFSSNRATHIVIEGVLMYLTLSEREELLRSLRDLFPRNYVYCDLMRRSFYEKYSRKVHEKMTGLGASFKDIVEQPEDLFANAGYDTVSLTSIPLSAAKLGAGPVPHFFIRWLFGVIRRGYFVGKFKLD